MARELIPRRIIEEANRLFDEYMAQKKGAFSPEGLIAYVEEHCSDELRRYRLTEHINEMAGQPKQ